MMRMSRTKLTGLSPINGNSATVHGGATAETSPENWELRPSGMLVQKRVDNDENIKHPPTIRVRVKFGSRYHDIYISSQATFGELKKKLTEPTGLHHEDQKLYYKNKERDSKQFLDIVGVKDKSKMVLMEDPISQEKRYLEMRKNAVVERASKSISQISLEVDKLASQVTALESVISKGGRVAEKELVNLIELLMNELIKLDGIVADGDVKLQRKMQVRRVQKYVETLDMLKVKNSMPSANRDHTPTQKQSNIVVNRLTESQERASNVGKPPRAPQQQQRHSIGHSPLKPQAQDEQPSRDSNSRTVVTTQWETFDSTPPLIPLSATSSDSNQVSTKFPWDVFALCWHPPKYCLCHFGK